jgi:predicted TIM-barrel fold metal-dependent hydrolase
MACPSPLPQPPTCLAPNPPVARAGLRLPAGSCDSHCHVFAAPEDHPFFAGRGYTPSIVTLDDYVGVMDAFGIGRAVLVQPSVYGTDNAVLLEALAREPERLCGVVVIPADTPDAELDRLHAAGVRGVRINRHNPGGLPLSAIQELGQRIARLGWHLQLQIEVEATPDLARLVGGAGVPIVIDHFGLCRPKLGPGAPGFGALLRLVDNGTCWVKLSAPYRLAEGLQELRPFVESLVSANPDRLLWATDWPHTECYDRVPDDADLVALVDTWLPTPELRRKVLIDNPNRLYWNP